VTPIAGRLAGAVGPEQRERRSRGNVEVDAVEDPVVPNDLRRPSTAIITAA
jgi:hypothetical protein